MTDGLIYYMPKKDFLVSVTVKSGAVQSLTLGVTPAYPDTTKPYLIRYGQNPVGKNTLEVTVTATGLLSASKATTVSQVSDFLKDLAGAAGTFKVLGATPGKSVSSECQADGVHTFIFPTSTSYGAACGVNIKFEKLFQIGAEKVGGGVAESGDRTGVPRSGVYYRVNLPYKVTAEGQGVNAALIVLSPSESGTLFLPITRTLFSNNEADFTFDDGTPKKYKQDTEGELIALVKLPALIVGAYFEAIGKVFESFKKETTGESEAIKAAVALQAAKYKADLCIAALKAGETDKISKLQC